MIGKSAFSQHLLHCIVALGVCSVSTAIDDGDQIVHSSFEEFYCTFPLNSSEMEPSTYSTAQGVAKLRHNRLYDRLTIEIAHDVVSPTSAKLFSEYLEDDKAVLMDLGTPTSPITFEFSKEQRDLISETPSVYLVIASDDFPLGEICGNLAMCGIAKDAAQGHDVSDISQLHDVWIVSSSHGRVHIECSDKDAGLHDVIPYPTERMEYEDTSAVPAGTKIKLTATPDDSNIFEGWSLFKNGGLYLVEENPLETIIESEFSIKALFGPALTPDQVVLHATWAGMGSVAPLETVSRYTRGASVELQAEPQENWKFVRWEGDAEPEKATSPKIKIIMNSNKKIHAVFLPIDGCVQDVNVPWYNAVVTHKRGFEEHSEAEYLPHGACMTVKAEEYPGWYFRYWHGGPIHGSAKPEETIILEENLQLYALYSEKARVWYDAEHVLDDKRTIKLKGGTLHSSLNINEHVIPPVEVTFTATPELGWEFSGWLGDLESYAEAYEKDASPRLKKPTPEDSSASITIPLLHHIAIHGYFKKQ